MRSFFALCAVACIAPLTVFAQSASTEPEAAHVLIRSPLMIARPLQVFDSNAILVNMPEGEVRLHTLSKFRADNGLQNVVLNANCHSGVPLISSPSLAIQIAREVPVLGQPGGTVDEEIATNSIPFRDLSSCQQEVLRLKSGTAEFPVGLILYF